MLGADGLNLALTIADSGIIDAAVNDLMGRSQVMLMAEHRGVSTSVKKHVLSWRRSVRDRMARVGQAERFQQEINLYQEVIHWREDTFLHRLPELMQRLEKSSRFYRQAKRLVDNNKGVDNPVFPHYFCEQWYRALSDAIREEEILELESHKEQLLADLYQRMETLRNMNKVTEAGDTNSVGRLWDMASAKLSRNDLTTMKQHAKFLQRNKGLQDIAEQLGRMASDVDDPSLNRAPQESLDVVEEASDWATDDIVGVHNSDDLNKLLPNEALFLTYPELEVVFYKRLLDKRLMNYRMQGKSRTLREVKTHKPESKKADIDKGPFILCVDASGSMSGFPEHSAKAFAYALMQIALADDRDCYVMLFSTEHIAYELTRQDGLREASDFLSYTFHGGTDFEPVIHAGMEKMATQRYKNADIVMISDFIAPRQDEAILAQVAELKRQHNRFHAVCLSRYGNPELLSMFDHCWRYHPNLVGRLVKRW
ncbi:ATPase RavA stimulator ViaA [Vibrio zhugei]|uniref:ATPase RavA stimulator ViaA n=1 Tax=Vibrio zhugei TaxID=2479546 RepID=A0ABV7C8K9_9VIBR|nr:ATPase RavA stimulator ViaA [Vibrio zhugei]